ncbi:hypothetical protein EII29_09820 [Leptotrichia sp. OH3620_COT-345]|uniref:hypothetical protein n=1 Tax=Leptotrichia sp. OH3620_COT-345 TaxID=2491048 RepID=UPI000F655200|nr:hypothetical protein [Leptotrichia sp. OH3620_COT-345]RRD38813.1 hypothetical protein EII29_09820 [Leptotrichia sp. OH3620_COT-345]
MALTQTQIKLTALFAVVEKKVTTHYLDRFSGTNPDFLSENETINIKDLNDFLVEAGIIERGSEIPYIKVNGIDSAVITPDIIAASYPLKPIMPTSTVTLIGGKEISAQDFEDDRLLAKLKNAILKTKEKAAANIFLLGKYLQKESGTVIDYKYEEPKEIDAKTVENWVMFFFKLIDDYEEKNGIYPDRLELGRKLFEKIIKNNEFLEIAKAYSNSIGLSSDKQQVYLDLLGQRISKLKNAKTFEDKDINVDEYIYLSSDAALVSAYAALEAVDDSGNPFVARTTEILDKKAADKETARGKMFAKTGFTPVVAIKEFIVRYKVKNIDSIVMSKAVSDLDAIANYYLTMEVASMTAAISTLTDKDLLNYMLIKETRKSGKDAINSRLGEL